MSTARNGRRGRMARGAWLALAAVAALAVGTAPAVATTVAYPDGPSTFDGDAQGWVGTGSSCSLLAGTGIVCTTENVHDPDGGNPGGAIATNVTVTANAGGLLRGSGTWLSPPFTVRDGEVANVTFSYDRLFDAGGLARLEPNSEVTVALVDQESGATVVLLSEMLAEADGAFAPRGAGVSAATVVAGHTYRLRIATETTSNEQSIAVLGTSSTRFDNVRLAVSDALPGTGDGSAGGGGNGPSVSAGVRIAGGPLSASAIATLMRQLSHRAEVGTGPGGSLVPLDRCTIVGTAGADRILATRGNDVICGLGGRDVILGAAGRDIVDGGNGNDRLVGGRGGDLLLGLRGSDRLSADAGRDRAGGGAGRDRVHGGAGNDRLAAGRARDRLHGGPGRDRLHARKGGRDRLNGGGGRDRAVADRRDRLRRIERVVR